MGSMLNHEQRTQRCKILLLMKLKSWLELSKDDNNWHKFQLDMSDSLRFSVLESSARIPRYHVEIAQDAHCCNLLLSGIKNI